MSYQLSITRDEALSLSRALSHFLSDMQPTTKVEEDAMVSIHNKLALILKK
tara:strand:- start:690 stop:842 length:153 start_codon:yes stop_codon:yes gene_type:complete